MPKTPKRVLANNEPKVVITKDGPYLVSGRIPLIKEVAIIGKDGQPERWGITSRYPQQEDYALCRCGESRNMPFCDGTHVTIRFDGKETAGKKTYLESASKITGPTIDLTDEQDLCAGARFCHKSGGTWANVRKSDNPKAREDAVVSAGNCSAGRLVVWDKATGKPIEPAFEPTISLTEDPERGVSGPIWLKGCISFESADGRKYETRNRVTLCRCGKSRNKPFCDGSHVSVKFNDGDESLKAKP
ncbi:MAG: iron-binding protein [Candidatus Thorarchaeota archaeon]|nr:MAG: iron-binding protein [Candidatus Thorarchaeota archaeon]